MSGTSTAVQRTIRSVALQYNAGMSEGHPRFTWRTLAITSTLLCAAAALVAAYPREAFGVAYSLLYPVCILVMVSLIVGVLVVGRLLIEKILSK
jgi:hypothetical protein